MTPEFDDLYECRLFILMSFIYYYFKREMKKITGVSDVILSNL